MQNALLEHSTILSTFIRLPFFFETFVLSKFEWSLKTGCTVLSHFHVTLALAPTKLNGYENTFLITLWLFFQPTKTVTTTSKDPNVVQSQQEEDDIAKGSSF